MPAFVDTHTHLDHHDTLTPAQQVVAEGVEQDYQLRYLRKLQFSTIKVDRSFVQGAAQGSKESIAIIRAVIAMADSLEMTTTAEGVEDAEEAELIRKLGCTKIQGYYFGRPMPGKDARALFARRDRLTA